MKYLLVFLIGAASCSSRNVHSKVILLTFKAEFIYDRYGSAVMLPVSFGDEEKKYSFQFDNHSPSWINGYIINETNLKKVKNTSYSTSAADGNRIEGDVYECDMISIGGIKMENLLFYKIDDTLGRPNGVIGENIISKGAWMIDFDNNKVMFSSSVDSFGTKRIMYESRRLPTTYNDNTFTVEVAFSNGVTKMFEVDLGFNGVAILPLKDFIEISNPGKTFESDISFKTPAGDHLIKSTAAHERVLLGTDSVSFLFSTNDKVAENLLGLGFFKQFEFVILDYPNKQIYVSR